MIKSRIGPTPLYISDFVEITQLPRKTPPEVFAKIYQNENLSAQQISERVGLSKQAVLARLRKAGVRNGRPGRLPDNYRYPNPPYGYKVHGERLIVDKKELRTVRLIVHMREQRNMGWEEIARELGYRGLLTRRKRDWNRAGIKRVWKRWRGKV